MFLSILENYINKLTIKDIILFSNKNNILLNSKEINYIYNVIKNDYKTLLSDNYDKVFKKAKDYIEEEKLKKIYNLFLDYRSKYQNYFN
ncbi:MAG: DUF2624 family protein [Bacilli bacterium]|nr:DUF2624 family protein [Bacilli bacterium]